MSFGAKVVGKKSRSAYSRVIQTRAVERRNEVRKIMRERVYVELCLIGDESQEPSQTIYGFITDVSSRGLGLIVEVDKQYKVPVLHKFEIRVFGRTFEGVIEANLVWLNELPSLGGIIKLRDQKRDPGEADQVPEPDSSPSQSQIIAMRAGLSVDVASSEAQDFMLRLINLAHD